LVVELDSVKGSAVRVASAIALGAFQLADTNGFALAIVSLVARRRNQFALVFFGTVLLAFVRGLAQTVPLHRFVQIASLSGCIQNEGPDKYGDQGETSFHLESRFPMFGIRFPVG